MHFKHIHINKSKSDCAEILQQYHVCMGRWGGQLKWCEQAVIFHLVI